MLIKAVGSLLLVGPSKKIERTDKNKHNEGLIQLHSGTAQLVLRGPSCSKVQHSLISPTTF
jgi:hypothetical protein